jgi:hypothetical protein
MAEKIASAKVVPKESNEIGKDVEKDSLYIPPSYLTYLYMFSAKWLSVNETDENNCNAAFIGGNINLSLICALLFTTYLPLYYGEANRLNDENDGLTIDMHLGYLNTQYGINLSKDLIHDMFDTAYLVAAASTLFGTMVSVFYMLAANEAASDAKTFVLMKYLGPTATQMPYFFFTIGVFSWAFGGLLHVFTVPRSLTGFTVKIVFLWSMIFVMLVYCFPRMIRGVYAGKAEEMKHKPIFLTEEVIKAKIDEFLAQPNQDGEYSLKDFLTSLTYMTEHGYRPPLQVITKVKATYIYYEKIAALTGRTIDEVKEIVQSS